MPNTDQSDFDFDTVMTRTLPAGFASVRRRVVPVEELVTDSGPLTDEMLEAAANWLESGENIGYDDARFDLKSIRHRHHRLAQLLITGTSPELAAQLCNYNIGSVYLLQKDPAFIELMSYYSARREEEFDEFNSVAASLSVSMVHRLGELLDTQPEKLSPTILLDAIRTLADRSGHAPVSRNITAQVDARDIGSRLSSAQRRLDETNRLRNITPEAPDDPGT